MPSCFRWVFRICRRNENNLSEDVGQVCKLYPITSEWLEEYHFQLKTTDKYGAQSFIITGDNPMVGIPKDVMDLMTSEAATKILVTAGADGQPHAIVCGSIFATPDGKAGVGEILMKRAAKNLKDTGKAALTVAAGPKAYELILKNPARADSGPQFEGMKAKMAEFNLPCFALWTFDVVEIWDESAGPTAGTKIC